MTSGVPVGPSDHFEGLSTGDAARRLSVDGPNAVPVAAGTPSWRLFLAQMTHFFALLLWVAGALAFVGDLPELGVAIFVVVVANAVFAFLQERRAEKAMAALRDLLPHRVRVVRSGRLVEVDAAELVVGDLVELAEGDRVPADLQVVRGESLRLDMSMLTGESVPVAADVGDELYAGTFVVEGEARATVTRTGGSTRLGGIAELAQASTRPRSPLENELHRLVRAITLIALGVGVSFFLLTLVIDIPPSSGFVFAIGVTVALVPEGLLPTVTLSLAVGAQRMAARNALVRHLPSVETLGSTTVICTDKTGTLTRNEMAVVEVWTPQGAVAVRGEGYDPLTSEVDAASARALDAAATAAVVARHCSSGRAAFVDRRWVPHGDPMEAAIDTLARRLGAPEDTEELLDHPGSLVFAFDPHRRRMSVVADGVVHVKGAPDSVLAVSEPLADAQAAMDALADRGLRVLAVARRVVEGPVPSSPAEAEAGLTLCGLLGFQDPPRAGVSEAIAECRRAGIKVVMITGDHPRTASAIADQIGLREPESVVLRGDHMATDPAGLGALVDHDGTVVARADPEDKLHIARALQHGGNVVAMTGDGVNDGPALQQADIGVAMGLHGSDVARDAADLVLLDDDFSTILAAVKGGRATFTNMRKFLTYHLSDNVAELTPLLVWALSGTRFPLALGVMQILALDLVTDTFSAVALGAELPRGDVLDRPPVSGRLLDRRVARRAFGLLGPTEAIVSMAAFVVSMVASGWWPGEPFPTGVALATASGAAFAAVVIGQSANAFACRSSTRRPGELGWFSNRMLVWAVAVEGFLATVMLAWTPMADLLGQAWPSWPGLGVAVLAAPAVLGADALEKAHHRRRRA